MTPQGDEYREPSPRGRRRPARSSGLPPVRFKPKVVPKSYNRSERFKGK